MSKEYSSVSVSSFGEGVVDVEGFIITDPSGTSIRQTMVIGDANLSGNVAAVSDASGLYVQIINTESQPLYTSAIGGGASVSVTNFPTTQGVSGSVSAYITNPVSAIDQLEVINALTTSDYDIANSSYSAVLTRTADYYLDGFELTFAESNSKTITLRDTGTGHEYYKTTTSASSVHVVADTYFDKNTVLALVVTQTTGSDTMDVVVRITTRSEAMPSTGAVKVDEIWTAHDSAAFGHHPFKSTEHKFGRNLNIDNTGWKVLTENADTDWAMPSGASILQVSSSAANDSSGGTAAWSIVIDGLDASFNIQKEEVYLNGTTPVSSVNEYLRVNRMYIAEVGTYNSANEGNIDVFHISQPNYTVRIPADFGQTQQAVFTVPATKTATVKRFDCFIDATKTVEVRGFIRLHFEPFSNEELPPSGVPSGAKRVGFYTRTDTSFNETFEAPLVMPPKTDLWIESLNTAAGDAQISASWDMMLVSTSAI